MRYFPAIRSFIVLLTVTTPSIVLGDDDIKFVHEVCLQGMVVEPSVPRSESEVFCSCMADDVNKTITQSQRLSIRDARNLIRLGQPVPRDIFQKSGLKKLIEKSQEDCIKSLWPEPSKISDKDHAKYSFMVDRSLVEFKHLMHTRCNKYPKSKERTQCVIGASKEWLKTKGRQYIGIPPDYITANDIAKKILEDNHQ